MHALTKQGMGMGMGMGGCSFELCKLARVQVRWSCSKNTKVCKIPVYSHFAYEVPESI